MTLLTDLQESQDAELALFASLKRPGISDSDRATIIQNINAQTAVRTTAYAALANAYAGRVEESEVLSTAAAQQLETLQLLEKQLNQTKSTLADKQLETLKMIEITSYAGQQYKAHAHVLASVAAVVVLFLGSKFLVAKLERRNIPYVNFLPSVVALVGIIYIFTRMYDLLMRRNDVFDEYAWLAAPKTSSEMATANATSSSTIVAVQGLPTMCVGSNCCADGTEWTDASGCVVSASMAKPTSTLNGQELTLKAK